MMVSDTIAPILSNLFLFWWLEVERDFSRLIGCDRDCLFDFAEAFVPGDDGLGAGGEVRDFELAAVGSDGKPRMIEDGNVSHHPGVDVAFNSEGFRQFEDNIPRAH